MKKPCHLWIQPCHHIQPSYLFPVFPLKSNLLYPLSCLFPLQQHSNAVQPCPTKLWPQAQKKASLSVLINNLSVHFLNLSTVFLNFSPGNYFFSLALPFVWLSFFVALFLSSDFSPPPKRTLRHKHFVFYLCILSAVISLNYACISSPNNSSHSSNTFLPACPVIHEARDGPATGIKIKERNINPINLIETKFIIDVY